jgi:fucose permease
VLILSALLVALALRLAANTGSGVFSASESGSGKAPRPLSLRRLALFGCIFPLYVGTEAALGGWLTEHTRRLGGSAPVWGLTTAAFWGGLTAGRALLAAAVPAAREDRVAASGLALATCSLAALLVAGDERLAAVGAAGAGLGLSPMFPVTVAALAREAPGRAGGPLIALGSVGGASLPWLVGIVSSRTGSLRAGLSVLLATSGMLIALQTIRVRTPTRG